MKFLNLLNPYRWLILLAVVAGLIGYHYYAVSEARKEAVIATQTAMNAEYQAKLDAAREAARITEDKIKTDNEAALKVKDERITYINKSLDIALDSLRKRPFRPTPSNSSPAPSPTSSCTGAQLYQEDGEFLAREAARADRALTDRDYYYEQYRNAQQTLKEFSNGNTTANP